MLNSIKPEDRPKAIGLMIAIAVVFVFGGFNLIRALPGGGASPAPSGAPSASPDATPGVDPRPAAGNPSSGTRIDGAMYVPRPRMPVDKLAILEPNFGSDPFRPIVAAKSSSVIVPSVAPLQNATSATITQVPNPPLLSTVSFPHAALSAVAPAPVVVPLKLTGVVAGSDAIAMIGDGAGQHFLHRGDAIQGYRIVQIDEDAVTLRRANAGKILRVGNDSSEQITFVTPVAVKQATKVASVKPATPATKTMAPKPLPAPVASKPGTIPAKLSLAQPGHVVSLVASATAPRVAPTVHSALTRPLPAPSPASPSAESAIKGH